MSQRRLPFEPLRAHVAALGAIVPRGVNGGIARLGWFKHTAMEKAWQRAKCEGTVTVRAADKFATDLGVHPSQIWGEAWYHERKAS